MLNRLLPNDITILAWSPVNDTFDARFSCVSRTYHYFFSTRNLDIPAMTAAAALYVGTNDFRHFCKLDPSKVHLPTFFTRTVHACTIAPIGESMAMMDITGRAFLWHQVRMLMAVLFLIGRGDEPQQLITELFSHPELGRPQYDMAPEHPLTLAKTTYDESQLNWQRTSIGTRLHELETSAQIRYLLVAEQSSLANDIVLPSTRRHLSVLKRPRADSVDVVLAKSKLKTRN